MKSEWHDDFLKHKELMDKRHPVTSKEQCVFKKHAFVRMMERTVSDPEDILDLLDNNKYCPIGYEQSKGNRRHDLIYLEKDDGYFVVVRDVKTNEIVTLLPRDKNSWYMDPWARDEALRLASPAQYKKERQLIQQEIKSEPPKQKPKKENVKPKKKVKVNRKTKGSNIRLDASLLDMEAKKPIEYAQLSDEELAEMISRNDSILKIPNQGYKRSTKNRDWTHRKAKKELMEARAEDLERLKYNRGGGTFGS